MAQNPLPHPDVLQHVVDAHCHPTDKEIPAQALDDLKIRLCIMATREDDQAKVGNLATQSPDKIIPSFGWHPWASYRISLAETAPLKRDHYASILLAEEAPSDHLEALDRVLEGVPEPTTLSSLLNELRENFTAFPNALLGEVGLDRAFRVPFVPYPDPAGGKLSPFRVPSSHQLTILEAQVDLAIELHRSVSMHSVKSQELTLEFLKHMKEKHGEAFGSINIDLHSCGFSLETWKTVEKLYPNVFLSLSVVINARSPAHEALIKSCSPSRMLAESDYNNIARCEQQTWDMVCTIARVRGWNIESEPWDEDAPSDEAEWGVVRRLAANWRLFTGPGLGLARPTAGSRKQRTRHDFHSDSEDETDS